ncbi:FAD-dependent oxidoreductase [Oribacterium sp. WCC10]|uniref:FAD-dependent oxidoreductase n=1 Tax=Oribacterium sp. WCC10 TaxID=1855343 RepID=UPI0008E51BF8|nr:FAD-dependent oxidoreductase [Oribacterium sp. WCC10]SFG66797.1 fumarate reductase flavoprotein subunit [Oribacterium sp. WCC10]
MKKTLIKSVSVLAALSMAACGSTEIPTAATAAATEAAITEAATTASENGAETGTLTDGTYTASAKGMDGDITAEVVVKDGKIAEINFTEQNETAGVGDKALQLMSQDIIEHQSLAVDGVSGATITSGALRMLMADAIGQAGGDASEWKNREIVVEKNDEMLDCDVVVVGAGIAGLAAAEKASRDGASVIVVEKLSFGGGTSIFSSGSFIAAQTEEEVPELVDKWVKRNKITERNPLNMDKINTACAVSPDVLELLTAANVDYKLNDEGTMVPAPSEQAKKNAETIQLATAQVKVKGGQALVNQLEDDLKANGVDIYFNTTATKLITDDQNNVTGVICDSRTGTKTINAKAVILACGDYAWNDDLTAELAPDALHNYTSTAVSNTGDGINMAVEVGAVKSAFGESMSGCFAPDPYDMPVVGQPNNSYPFECLLLDNKGERPVAEDLGVHSQMIHFINEGEPDYGWVVMDQEIADKFFKLDEYLERTSEGSVIQAYKEDSIEALAKDMNLDPATVQATVDEYNKMCDSGEDTDNGKDAQYLSSIDEGPFYAVKEYDLTRGNYGGIETNLKGEVTDKDGNAIPGLYAAGIISSAGFFGDYYPGREALGVGAYMGFISGESAAAYAAQ